MKLSKKVAVIFIISSMISIASYILSSNITFDYFYENEVTRVMNISSKCIDELENEVDIITANSREYMELIKSVHKIYNQYGIDVSNELGISDKLTKDTIDYKVTFDDSLNTMEVFKAKTENYNSDIEVEYIIEKAVEYSNNVNRTKYSGIMPIGDTLYITTMNPIIIDESEGVIGYLGVFEQIKPSYINIMGLNIDKEINLVSEKSIDGKVSTSKLDNGEVVTLTRTDKNIKSYYNVPVLMGKEEVYLEITEPLVIQAAATKHNATFIGILIISNILINIMLFMIIKKIVVKRVYKINESINNINTTKSLKYRIEGVEGNDEISALTKDINNMFDTLECSNEIILKNEIKYSKLFNSLTNGFVYLKIINKDDKDLIDAEIIEVNEAFNVLLEIKETENRYVNNNVNLRSFADEYPVILEVLEAIYSGETNFTKEIIKLNNRYVNMACYSIEEDNFAIIMTDITENKKYSEEMRYLANFDVLTGLPNRYSLFNYMGQLKYEKKDFSIYFIDLDNFKTLNDTLGHNSGDEVLCEAANALRWLEIDNFTVGRLGGDEFLVVKDGLSTNEEIEDVGNKILKSLNKTFAYSNYTYELRASVGASSSFQHTTDIETLVKYADIAMYRSKNNGGNRVEVFSNSMLEEINIETKLKKAIEDKEFIVYYQPIYNLKANKTIGAEALVRWISNGEVIVPDKFIPIAKRTGDICEIDNFVLEEACRFCREKRQQGYEGFQVSINASYRFLKQPKFKEKLEEVLNKNQLEANALKLEITEDEILDNPDYIISMLATIKSMGVKVALDDFGVGYSSFNHIKMLPIDTIKIDRSLLITVEEDEKTLAIIDTLIKLAHTLGLDVVCEGVEIDDQLILLQTLNCDKIQGYLISRPITEKQFNEFLV